ncbi:hypothetical protein Ahu01nite_080050 [Winogradskya humida]|uniref:AbrB family looped-hinge helix DNA binding protein n=1 Tax=Winogradskya humida TaxID=113566 RepID=A0ABQ4A234_9ACTN|nr:hypothetical protein Ahu01nite_080050 [Actinoplanes humidus]
MPPLPIPDVSPSNYIRPAHYSVTAVDGNGRIAVTSPLRALGWPPGTLLAFSLGTDRVIAVTRVEEPAEIEDTAPRREVTPRGFVNLPVIIRRRAGVISGDRLLVAANAEAGVLLILTPTAVAMMLHRYTNDQGRQP